MVCPKQVSGYAGHVPECGLGNLDFIRKRPTPVWEQDRIAPRYSGHLPKCGTGIPPIKREQALDADAARRKPISGYSGHRPSWTHNSLQELRAIDKAMSQGTLGRPLGSTAGSARSLSRASSEGQLSRPTSPLSPLAQSVVSLNSTVESLSAASCKPAWARGDYRRSSNAAPGYCGHTPLSWDIAR